MSPKYDTTVLAIAIALFAINGERHKAIAQGGFEQTEVRRMLSDAWDVTATARALADNIIKSQVSSETSTGISTGILSRAYALTLIKQRRYPEALEATRSLLAIDDGDVRLRWAEVWLLLVNRKHDAALERCVDLAELAAAGHDAPSEAQVDVPEMLESVGTAIGFLEGPGRASVSAAIIDQRLAKIAGLLDESQQASLERGRQTVIGDFTQREQQSRIEDQEEFEATEAQRQADLQYLEVQRLGLAQEQTELIERQRRLEADSRETASRLRQREEEANTAALELADDAAYMASRLILIDGDLVRLDIQISQTRDPAIRAILIAQRNDLIRVHRIQRADLRATQVQLASANQNLAVVRNDRITQNREIEQSQAALARSQRSIDKAIQRIGRQETDLVEPKNKVSARSRVQRKRTAAWSTYRPYPVEAERQRIMDELN